MDHSRAQMPPATSGLPGIAPSPPLPTAHSPQTIFDLVNHLVSLLLLSSQSVRSFVGRWQVIHGKLSFLRSSLSEVSDSPHWSENPLIHTLLQSLLTTLQRLKSLCDQCSESSFNGGKLHMQSDLDRASTSLSDQLHDLDLLLRSGVLRQSNAIVLSHPGPGSDKEDLGFFIRDLFTRLQIGGIEFKKKAMESLLQLLKEDEKSASVVAKEGNIGYLIHLLDFNTHPALKEQAVGAISVLALTNDEARKSVFEGGGLGPLLRILETGSTYSKEKAAMAVEAITADPDNGWAVSAYGGVSVLIEACRSGSPVTQEHALGAIRNAATVEDVKTTLAEEGAIPVLLQLLVSGGISAQEKAANSVAILASSGDYFRALVIQERGLQRLMHLMQESSGSETLEHVLRAISSLSVSDSVARILSSSTIFVMQLGRYIQHGNLVLQQISASLLASLSISDGNKRAICNCMGTLVKLMEMPKPVGLHESAAQALASLLTARSNQKELARDEKSLTRLVQMLDPKNELCGKKLPIMVVGALLAGGSNGTKKRLLAAGAHQHLQRLSEMEISGAKKALQRLTGNRLRSIFSRTWRE